MSVRFLSICTLVLLSSSLLFRWLSSVSCFFGELLILKMANSSVTYPINGVFFVIFMSSRGLSKLDTIFKRQQLISRFAYHTTHVYWTSYKSLQFLINYDDHLHDWQNWFITVDESKIGFFPCPKLLSDEFWMVKFKDYKRMACLYSPFLNIKTKSELSCFLTHHVIS